MKPLLVTYEYPPLGGGAGKAARATAFAMASMGCEPAILTSCWRGLPADSMEGPVRVFRLPVPRRRLNQASAAEILAFGAAALAMWPWAVRRFHPDAVFAYMTIPCAPAALVIAASAGAPCVTLLRGQDVPGHPETPGWMQRLALPVTLGCWRASRAVVANSEGLAAMARAAAPDVPIHVVPNGIDPEKYSPANPNVHSVHNVHNVHNSPPYRVAYVGRLVREKRLRELVEAWPLVRAKLSGAELVLAGFGPEAPMLERLARERGVADSVRLPGRIEEAEVIALLRSGTAFANFSSGEGMPNAVLEAMSCAVPCVLSDIPPHREIEGGSGGAVFIPDETPEGISGAIFGLIGDPERRRMAGEAARRRVTEAYSWEATAKAFLGLAGWEGGDRPGRR